MITSDLLRPFYLRHRQTDNSGSLSMKEFVMYSLSPSLYLGFFLIIKLNKGPIILSGREKRRMINKMRIFHSDRKVSIGKEIN